ncbi:MAG: MATE family efflux transporter [Alphaproteobacteria bacterium]|nr:MAG: MATE family efflux transporter [Alphaproteobacteria bacterium]
MMATRLLMPFFLTADLFFVGRLAGVEAGAYGLGFAPMLFLQFLVIGGLQPVLLMGAQAVGAGEDESLGKIARLGLLSLLLVVPAVGLMAVSLPSVFYFLDYAPDIASVASRTAAVFGLSVPFLLIFLVGTFCLETLSQGHVGLVALMIGTALNLLLNAVLAPLSLEISGDASSGVAYATVIARAAMAAVVWVYLLRHVDLTRYGFHGGFRGLAPLLGRVARPARLTAISYGAEHGVAMVMIFIAASFGPAALAVLQISLNYASLSGMAAVGAGAAGAVMVGRCVGANDPAGARRAGALAVAVGLTVLLPISLFTLIFPDLIVSLFLRDAVDVDSAARIFRLAALLILSNGLFLMAGNLVRAASSVRYVLGAVIAANILIAIPAGVLLARVLNLGVWGLMAGMIIGGGLVAPVLYWRFRRITARQVPRL